jgi:hypothetical protein
VGDLVPAFEEIDGALGPFVQAAVTHTSRAASSATTT